MIKTIELTGEVTAVDFSAGGKNPLFRVQDKYCWIRNRSEGNIYASLSEEITAGEDNVLEISSGECGLLTLDIEHGTVYLMGTGKAVIQSGPDPVCPFKLPAKGGDGGASCDILYVGAAGTADAAAVIENYSDYKYLIFQIIYFYTESERKYKVPLILSRDLIVGESANWMKLSSDVGTVYNIWYKTSGSDMMFYHTVSTGWTMQVIGVK